MIILFFIYHSVCQSASVQGLAMRTLKFWIPDGENKHDDFVDRVPLQNDRASSSSVEVQGSAECPRSVYDFAIAEDRQYQYEHWPFNYNQV